jgi:hypothetical protein
MSVDQLQAGFLNLAKRLYSEPETSKRRDKFKSMLRTSSNFYRRAAQPAQQLAA